MTGIYCIENKINGMKYVGQAIDIEKRWKLHRQHLNGNRHCNVHLQRAWNKYGEDAFLFYVLELCDKQSLSEREIHHIENLHTYENGYNMTMGGDGTRGCYHTDEYKNHMREIFIGRKFSDETLQKMSAAKKGKSQKNRAITESVINGYKVVSKKLKGRKFSDEHRKHLSEAQKGHAPWNKGKTMPDDWQHPMRGKHHTDETKKKIGEANRGKKRTPEMLEKVSKPVICIETGEIYTSITEASCKHGVTISAISRVLRGKAKTSAGMHWAYVERGGES